MTRCSLIEVSRHNKRSAVSEIVEEATERLTEPEMFAPSATIGATRIDVCGRPRDSNRDDRVFGLDGRRRDDKPAIGRAGRRDVDEAPRCS